MKKKYVFISNMAAPYQVKLCDSLQEFLDTEFWFYEYIEKGRPEWWKIPLGNKCKIMRLSVRVPKLGYISFGVIYELFKFKPDVILFGGFMPWHWLLMRIAKLLKVKVAFMSEPLRYKSTEIASNENSSIKMKIIRKMCSGADLYIGMGEVAAKQFIEEIGFPVEKVEIGKYPQDIEEYYNHPLRYKKQGNTFRILFANRLVDRYQPLFALEVFEKLLAKYPNIELYMNNEGPLKQACINYINNSKLKNVHFLEKIDSWNNMHLIYKQSDILILPANYSNGNGTIIEARASGMGVVISNKINHIDEHSIHEKNCFICELNINEFVDAISKYIDNPEKLAEHGKISRELVENRKNSYTAKAYYDVFNKHRLVD